MNKGILLLLVVIQIAAIRGQQSCCVDKQAVEKYCPEGYSCCECSECCSSTEFCASSHCVSYLLVVFGPASLVIFLLAVWMNIIMNKREKQYKFELQRLSEPDAQIHLPHIEGSIDDSENEDNPANNQNEQVNNDDNNNNNNANNLEINDDQTAVPNLLISRQQNKNNKQNEVIDDDETRNQFGLNVPLINKNENEDEIEEQKNDQDDDDRTKYSNQQNIQLNKNPNNNQQNDDETYVVFKKND